MRKRIYFTVDEDLLEKFTHVAKSMGLSRSEAIRRAMEIFITIHSSDNETFTKRVRGMYKSRFSLSELEEIYMRSKLD